jgi:ubiquinone/menaquinone biosynthesis C-methylase UbiE
VKIYDSGMPEEKIWDGFFDQESILSKLQLTSECKDAVEFGCGYGTFTVPAAHIITGNLIAIDIEQEMLDSTKEAASQSHLTNIKCILRDFVKDGTGLPENSVDYAMVFNILHYEQPVKLLEEAFRVLRKCGTVGIIHWNYDPETPRGPEMSIRPKPEQCKDWAEQAGFEMSSLGIIDLPPFHYGMALNKNIAHAAI